MRKFVISFNIIISLLLGFNFVMLIIYSVIVSGFNDNKIHYKELKLPLILLSKNISEYNDQCGNKYNVYSIVLKDKNNFIYSKTTNIKTNATCDNNEETFVKNICQNYEKNDTIK